ncbi:MAG: hypothetical protein QNI84_05030 [Henriciella sp.]|nr:hypothetical protein [Henriciella sp.]
MAITSTAKRLVVLANSNGAVIISSRERFFREIRVFGEDSGRNGALPRSDNLRGYMVGNSSLQRGTLVLQGINEVMPVRAGGVNY